MLTSKSDSIDRFEIAERLVGYFGVFPRESSSNFDKQGKPNRSKTRHLSQTLLPRQLIQECLPPLQVPGKQLEFRAAIHQQDFHAAASDLARAFNPITNRIEKRIP